jgi:hypothetical protein
MAKSQHNVGKMIATIHRLGQAKWEDVFPEFLWEGGNGLCTSFAIAVNETAELDAKYVDYRNTHRAAHKVEEDKSVLVVDSTAGKVVSLDNGELLEKWLNIYGKVKWDKVLFPLQFP